MTEFCHLLFVYHIAEEACPGKCPIFRIERPFYIISSGNLAVFPDGFVSVILLDQIQEFVAGALVTEEDTAEGRCGSDRIGLLHTSEGHACV